MTENLKEEIAKAAHKFWTGGKIEWDVELEDIRAAELECADVILPFITTAITEARKEVLHHILSSNPALLSYPYWHTLMEEWGIEPDSISGKH